MYNLKKLIVCMAGAAFALNLHAQQVQGFVHKQSEATDYVWPTDQQVLDKLDKWQDQKFGVLFHWGLYSVPGIVESWSICSEDVDWISRKKPLPYDEYKEWYWGLKDSLNPVNFNPEQWADVMQDAGIKYMIFTTKHHDGFCTYDSKYTDFSIAHGAFKDNPRKNVAYHVFDAFRKRGFMTGCYFSKPDWHNENYWDPFFATPTRNPNYNTKKYPQKWAKFQEFTANQIDELMSDYGRIDILWLDGGWVRKPEQDINLDEIVDNARKKQPGLIAVDRTIPGRNENYQTPEQTIPKEQQDFPWESNITFSNTWGWNPNPKYKSVEWVINTLAEVVAKGGCFALNVGPNAEGEIDDIVYERLSKVGKWLDKNGEAIYATRITPIYRSGNVWFTANKDGKTLYAIYALPENEQLPAVIEWEGNIPDGRMVLLQNGKSVKYTCEGGKVKVTVPKGINNEALAFCFKLK